MRMQSKLALVGVVTITALAGCSSSAPTVTPSTASETAATQSASSGPTTITYAESSPTQTMDLYLPSDGGRRDSSGRAHPRGCLPNGRFVDGSWIRQDPCGQRVRRRRGQLSAIWRGALSGRSPGCEGRCSLSCGPTRPTTTSTRTRWLLGGRARAVTWPTYWAPRVIKRRSSTMPRWATPTSRPRCRLWSPGSDPVISAAWTNRRLMLRRARARRSHMGLPTRLSPSGWVRLWPRPTRRTRLTSRVTWPRPQRLPAWYLAHGDSDCLVPAGQSAELKAALDEASADSTYVVLEGAGHMDQAFDSTQLQPTIDFLKSTFGMS